MHIFLSIFSCAPNRGSEPGAGWAWLIGESRKNCVTAVTWTEGKEEMEEELAKLPQDQRPQVLYYNCPGFIHRLYQKKCLPLSIYYAIWLACVRFKFANIANQADIIHQATMCSFRIPGFWIGMRTKVLLGPLGGTSYTDKMFKRCFSGNLWIKESLRTFIIKHWRWNLLTLWSFKAADYVMFATKDAQQFVNLPDDKTCDLTEVVAAAPLVQQPLIPVNQKNSFIWCGNIIPRKGWQLAIAAMQQLKTKLPDCPQLHIYGGGIQMGELKDMIQSYQLEDKIILHEACPHGEVLEAMPHARAHIFSSIRDTTGTVVIEAMAAGSPTIGLNINGIKQLTTDRCAFRIPVTSWDQIVDDMAEAMYQLSTDDALVEKMGAEAKRLAREKYTIESQIQYVENIMQKICLGK